MDEATKKWAINNFADPGGITKAKIDPFTGAKPGPGVKSIDELFINGTGPAAAIPANTCGAATLQFVGFEKDHAQWLKDATNWIARARKGPGTRGGVNGTRTAFFYNRAYKPYGNSWGVVEGFGCKGTQPTPSCIPLPSPDASGLIPSFVIPTPNPSASGIAAVPCPPPSATASASASVEPSAPPTQTPTQAPTAPPAPTTDPRADTAADGPAYGARRPRRRRRPNSLRRPDAALVGRGPAVRVDLNADVGESLGAVADGRRRGADPARHERQRRLRRPRRRPADDRADGPARGVRRASPSGAHPGYPDLVGFGRRDLDMTPDELEASIVYQVGAVAAFAADAGVALRHVKPHGALYNRGAHAIRGWQRPSPGPSPASRRRSSSSACPASALIAAGRAAGLRTAEEGFADRAYEADGSLRSRRLDGAVHADAGVVAEQALSIVRDGRVTAHDGTIVAVARRHDLPPRRHPGAAGFARAIREALAAAGIAVAALEE